MGIRISWPSGEVYANLDETPTSKALIDALPIESRANTWGDEVYFSIPVNVPKEADAKQVVDPGTVCYWVEGTSLALPFGPTPISRGNECRLAAEVNLLGKLESDPRILGNVQGGDKIRIEEA
jgi:hypothetical protein